MWFRIREKDVAICLCKLLHSFFKLLVCTVEI